MRTISYQGWTLLVADQIKDQTAKELFDHVQNEQYTLTKVLKDNHRSAVRRVLINSEDLVLKVPKEKNARIWIRFLTLFRLGEAFKNLKSMNLLSDIGIKTTTPIMAAEMRSLGMVVESWLLYSYLDGTSCLDQPQTYPKVIDTLKSIHKKGYTHGDPQIRNFIKKENKIYVIDTNPKKAGLTGFDFGYEWAYLRKSAPGIEGLFSEILESGWYKFAYHYDLYARKFSRLKRRVLFRS
ncbi:lipopolysaccharide core heptose(II) kinase RfaY [Fulvivirga lutimaris]|uniref:lipopolysaccharide core heptose(II) kinase RfaY n=1 Tax=Fulvivirga lutimaris TaxID=1819566 RepID=UPI0012BD0B03|nr:lipopolysaccharide core heptose(II) kinase RfaY [Fulvivirga lutimaris]MTI38752.1 hypothetical protein [Fulvivirga lutimaris]